MAEIDLARLADGYRYRPPSPEALHRASETGRRLPAGSWIVDIGGGRGNDAAVWAEQGHRPVVLDPAPGMAGPAHQRGLFAVLGVSQELPFHDRIFALAWFHLTLHYGDWRRALDEAVRVTGDGGRVEVWTLAPDHYQGSLLARWFPRVSEIDATRFPAPGDVAAHLAERTRSVSTTEVVERKRRSAGEWAKAVAARYISTLQLLDDAELAAGLAAFRRAHPDPDSEIEYELRLAGVSAVR